MKILLIENNEDIRQLITYILTEQGAVVREINARERLEAIAAQRPSLVMVDEWQMAGEGQQLCRRIKDCSALKEVPVILLSTAHDVGEIAAQCGADGFIRKPFELQELLAVVFGYEVASR